MLRKQNKAEKLRRFSNESQKQKTKTKKSCVKMEIKRQKTNLEKKEVIKR